MSCFNISTAQSYQVIEIILNEFTMFVNLSRHNFFESLDVVLHELENVDYDVDDIFSFDD